MQQASILGYWLHFGYLEQLDMDVSVWEMFVNEAMQLQRAQVRA